MADIRPGTAAREGLDEALQIITDDFIRYYCSYLEMHHGAKPSHIEVNMDNGEFEVMLVSTGKWDYSL